MFFFGKADEDWFSRRVVSVEAFIFFESDWIGCMRKSYYLINDKS